MSNPNTETFAVMVTYPNNGASVIAICSSYAKANDVKTRYMNRPLPGNFPITDRVEIVCRDMNVYENEAL